MREILSDMIGVRRLLVLAAAVILLTILGPFGTYDSLNIMGRFLFWLLALLSVGVPMHIAMRYCLGAHYMRSWPRPVCIAIGAALAAVPGTALVLLVSALVWPSAVGASSLVYTWSQVTAIGFVIGMFQFAEDLLMGENRRDGRAALRLHPAPVRDHGHLPSEGSTFHRRLEPDTGRNIISLSMQDHYVEVTTTEGSQLVLMRLSDAVEELDGLDGVQIHRSHWVALRHVHDMVRERGKLRVRLSDGRELPVSRTYADHLRARLDARA